jgi:hypothetical protein
MSHGGLVFSLSDYRDARAWRRAIREELVEHRMPPPIAARGYGDGAGGGEPHASRDG